MTVRSGRWAWVASVVFMLGAMVACDASPSVSPPNGPAQPGGQPYSTVAWFDPGSASIVVGEHDCDEKIRLEQTDRAVRIGTCSLPIPHHIGVACAHPPARVVRLRAPVGHRPLLGLDGSPLTAMAWTSRLHPPARWTPGMDLAVLPTNAEAWILSYGDVRLKSSPASGNPGPTSSVKVRGIPAQVGCAATLCWDERGISYQLTYQADPGSPTESLTSPAAQRGAVAAARRLVFSARGWFA